MNAELIVFFVLALVVVASALGMLVSRNAVYSALYLILNFATVAVFYLILGAPFVAMTQVTVYAGAIMVLFLFVIMLLGAERLPGVSGFNWQKPLAWILALVLIGEASYAVFVRDTLTAEIGAGIPDYSSAKEIGSTLFTDFFLPFQITAVLLLAAMIGAIVITKREQPKKRRP